MAYDQVLEKRIAAVLQDVPGLVKKKLFGGVCFMVNGHMACGVHKNGLIVRLSAGQYAAALGKPYTRPFDLTGRPMTGWLVVDPEGVSADAGLAAWVTQSLDYARSLPPK